MLATKKSFTVENYEDMNYKTLHPLTNSGQVLLTNAAKDALFLNNDDELTLNDAFYSIIKDYATFKVGDLLLTVRDNLGDKWLLCNGAPVLLGKYPELNGILTQKRFNFILTKQDEPTDSIASITGLNFDSDRQSDEKFLISMYTSESPYTTLLYIATNIDNVFTWVKLDLSFKKIRLAPRVKNVNGIWFVLQTGDGYSGYNYYCNGNPYITDNYKIPNSMTGTQLDVVYANGKYYFNGYLDNARTVSIYTSLDSAPVTIGSITNKSNMTVVPDGVLLCTNGHTLVTTPTRKYVTRFMLIKEDNSTEFYEFKDSGDSGSDNRIFYFNDKYYWFSYRNKKYYISTSNTLGNFITKYSGMDFSDIDGIVQTDDYLILPDGYYIDKTSDDLKSWDNYVGGALQTSVVIGSKNYYRMTSDKTTKFVTYECPIEPYGVLPEISITGVYGYIKAKSRNNYRLSVTVAPKDATIVVKDYSGNSIKPEIGNVSSYLLDYIDGIYTIEVSKVGYTTQTQTITNNKNQSIEFVLVKEPK